MDTPKAAQAPQANLQLDFGDVLGRDREDSSAKHGALVLNDSDFAGSAKRPAGARTASSERIPVVPAAGPTGSRLWIYLGVALLIPILGGGAMAFQYFRSQAAQSDNEVDELRKAGEQHRKLAQDREKGLVR